MDAATALPQYLPWNAAKASETTFILRHVRQSLAVSYTSVLRLDEADSVVVGR